MKPEALVTRLLDLEEPEPPNEQEREPTPSLTAPATGMARYPMDGTATENAIVMVGDGNSPDTFFVSIGDSFVEDEPGQIGQSYAIGQFDNGSSAEEKFNDVVLDGKEGPRWVQVENRLTGLIRQRFLRRVVSYQEETRD